MADHHHADLTRNQQLVLDALASAHGPLSAYTILDRLRDDGFRAPLQVYRALDKLVALGQVHRLESINAFVACRQPECGEHDNIAFTICEDCGHVAEISDTGLARRLKHVAKEAGFTLHRSAVELRGICQACSKAA